MFCPAPWALQIFFAYPFLFQWNVEAQAGWNEQYSKSKPWFLEGDTDSLSNKNNYLYFIKNSFWVFELAARRKILHIQGVLFVLVGFLIIIEGCYTI